MKVSKEYKVQLRELLKECDRMDLWKFFMDVDEIPEDPADLVELLVQEHPEKKERVVKNVRDINF